ncbi:LuxR family transcriptional regulator [Mycobacterium sp. PS03-16]|uniref:ATP-binding protein n=1 Tax=Mycobacterium sp. PS03-16 TaxID=2559611 RepID=UPI00107432C8|nr:LuxR family transcriptional regulator [Mycobacterium sp. PS03-16]TFV61461.1 LuxR family transcriptional regulator [Mycobacterium sp. PS03-16]
MPKFAAVTRPVESSAVAEALETIGTRPSALVLEGAAGIGKTTTWLTGIEEARRRGLRVLAARASAAESVLAYASLADLLADVDSAVLAGLPEPQRRALNRVLLLDAPDDVGGDPRAVAAGFSSVIGVLATRSPVLIAVDDVQWLDSSSAAALSFVSRRLTGPVGLLCTTRTDPALDSPQPVLRMPRPDDLRRIRVQPLSIGALHTILADRLGRTYPRPVMVRIHELSGGNPLYALELARALGDAATLADVPLPQPLTEVIRQRLDGLDAGLHAVLLPAACVARPTVELIAQVCDAPVDRTVEALEGAESNGVITLDGHHVRFTHPLLARVVYTEADIALRRATHRRLAGIVSEPEVRARHLALGATTGDPETLRALDEAADTARVRGAPAAAAELLDLAIGLGGDTPQRRIMSARHHFTAGDPVRAQGSLEATMAQLEPGALRAEAASLLGYVRLIGDSFPEAADLLQHTLPEAADHPVVLVPMLVTLAFALFNAGHLDAAYDRARDAVTHAERLGDPGLLAQALSMRAMIRFLHGDGADDPSMRRALALEDPRADVPLALRPSAHHAVLRSCAADLEDAHRELTELRKYCIEHGHDGDLMFIAFHAALNEIWHGDFAGAALIVEDSVELAEQLGGDVSLSVALSTRALLGAYLGRVDEARSDVVAAQEASRRCGSVRLGEWPTNALGFLEVSVGDYGAAVATLQPMLDRLAAAPRMTELIAASFAPDAVDALVNLGRHHDAEPVVAALEANGHRLDRPWMLAVGGRCRAMVLGARGDVGAALSAAEQALVAHERLPMPFERARTELVLGQLQRRHRMKEVAATTLRSALATFERLGTPLWAERVRAELGRANVGPHRTSVLTPSEQRVAELAASGLTNRSIAATMFISPKTVEANLSRVYAKLEIHSRAQLGRRMGELET